MPRCYLFLPIMKTKHPTHIFVKTHEVPPLESHSFEYHLKLVASEASEVTCSRPQVSDSKDSAPEGTSRVCLEVKGPETVAAG